MKPIATWNSARDVWEKPGTESIFCGHLAVYSGTFPTSGMTVNGVAYELPTWERRTDVSGFSSSDDGGTLLLTPVAAEGTKPSNTMGVARRQTTGQAFLTNQIVSLMGLDPSESSPGILTGGGSGELLPTPHAGLATRGGSQHPDKKKRGGHMVDLGDVAEHVLLPTPRATRGGSSTETVALLPTPTAMVANDGEETSTWLERRERVKQTADNGNGMGMPLTIASKLITESTGEPTNQPSEGGRPNSDEPLPGQLSLLDELEPND